MTQQFSKELVTSLSPAREEIVDTIPVLDKLDTQTKSFSTGTNIPARRGAGISFLWRGITVETGNRIATWTCTQPSHQFPLEKLENKS